MKIYVDKYESYPDYALSKEKTKNGENIEIEMTEEEYQSFEAAEIVRAEWQMKVHERIGGE